MAKTDVEEIRQLMKSIAALQEEKNRILRKLEGISPETRNIVQSELDRVAKLVYERERGRIPDLNSGTYASF